MTKSTEKARQVILEKKEALREERALQLYDFLEDHSGETAYSLSNKLTLPLGTVQSLLEDLEKEKLIKIIPQIEKGRLKKKAYVMGFDDYNFVDYHESELNDPLIQKLLEKTRGKGISVFIYRKDGSKIELKTEKQI